MKQFIKDLIEYPYIAEEIDRLRKELEVIASSKYETSITTKYSHTSGFGSGNVSDKTGEAVMKIIELYDTRAESIGKKIEKLLIKETKINGWLDELDYFEKTAIKLRFFENKSWKEIAVLMGQSVRNCQRFKDSALEKIQ